jgi:hypothetical protein
VIPKLVFYKKLIPNTILSLDIARCQVLESFFHLGKTTIIINRQRELAVVVGNTKFQ